MLLSDNFSLAEFTKSVSAIRMGIDNNPGPDEIEALRALCVNILQPLRNILGYPVHIGSGYRSPSLNSYVGGASSSQHMRGEAADLDCRNNVHAFEVIRNDLPFDQLIWEFGDDDMPDWVHVSFKATDDNRGEILKAVRGKYGTEYKIWEA